MRALKIIFITYTLILLNIFISWKTNVIPDQKEKDLVTLAEIYHSFSNSADIREKEEKILAGFQGHELEFSSQLIKEICSRKGNPFINKFVSRPDSVNLKYFYTIHAINVSMFDAADIDTLQIAVDVFRNDFNSYEALIIYYRSIFATLINKYDQKDLPEINFNLDELHFKNNIEKSIFFFQMIDMFHVPALMTIKMMNDYNQALKFIKSMPKINSMDYYNYNDFQFDDITLTIFQKQRGLKEYYMPEYYNLLVGHLTCLINTGKPKDEIHRLIKNSILSDSNYYNYFKDKKLLENIKNLINKI